MNIKILSSLTEVTTKRSSEITIGTHNGIFHSDELLACAILCLIHSNESVQILRTRDSEQLMECTICVDVGGGDFDHHQKDFNTMRNTGIKYASAGLVWKHYGKQLISLFLEKYFPRIQCDTDSIFETFDASFITLVDCEDNGKPQGKHCFSFISSFLPLWFNNSSDDFNKQFYKALVATMTILDQELRTTIGNEIAKNAIVSNWKNHNCFKSFVTTTAISQQKLKTTIGKQIAKVLLYVNWKNCNYFNNGVLQIPSQTMAWVEATIMINASCKGNKINFVIFPYPDGGWAAQCVPPSLKNIFGQRIPFPSEWAGQTDKLVEISGVEGATLCHNDCFFVRATSKEAVIQMCNIATNKI